MDKSTSLRLSKLGILDLEEKEEISSPKEELLIEKEDDILKLKDTFTLEDGTVIGTLSEINKELNYDRTIKTTYYVSIFNSFSSDFYDRIMSFSIYFNKIFIGNFNRIDWENQYGILKIRGVIINNNLLNNVSIYNDYHNIDSVSF